MRRETSRVSFLMCPFCVRRSSPTETTLGGRWWSPLALERQSRARRSRTHASRRLISGRGPYRAGDPATTQVSSRSDSPRSASTWRRIAIALGPMPWSLSRSAARCSVSCERRVMPTAARARVAGAPMRGSSSCRVMACARFGFVGSHGQTGTPDGIHRWSVGAPPCAQYASGGP